MSISMYLLLIYVCMHIQTLLCVYIHISSNVIASVYQYVCHILINCSKWIYLSTHAISMTLMNGNEEIHSRSWFGTRYMLPYALLLPVMFMTWHNKVHVYICILHIYIYIYLYIYIYIYISIHSTYLRMHTYVHTYIQIYVHHITIIRVYHNDDGDDDYI
jgi:hypothetical protein